MKKLKMLLKNWLDEKLRLYSKYANYYYHKYLSQIKFDYENNSIAPIWLNLYAYKVDSTQYLIKYTYWVKKYLFTLKFFNSL